MTRQAEAAEFIGGFGRAELDLYGVWVDHPRGKLDGEGYERRPPVDVGVRQGPVGSWITRPLLPREPAVRVGSPPMARVTSTESSV